MDGKSRVTQVYGVSHLSMCFQKAAFQASFLFHFRHLSFPRLGTLPGRRPSCWIPPP
ncbi:hypothetical protein HMI55_000878 [Coelomomyces lativittatus]|nr:hypothetical protein HMI55_000878 [Coelomomyces lativittatus]